ncbi:MAG: hypothetical protein WAP23_00985 [Candidatus Spechtbacterales bacterium]
MMVAWAAFGVSCISWIIFWISIIASANRVRLAGRFAFFFGLGSIALTVTWMLAWRSWFHGLWFTVFYANAGLWLGWLIVAAGAVLLGLLAFYIRQGYKTNIDTALVTGILTFVVFFVVGSIGWFASYGALYNGWIRSAMYDSLVYTELSEPRQTTNVRYLPQPVAFVYANNKLQESAVIVGAADPIVLDGEFVWQVARQPYGFWNQQKGNSDGIGLVDSRGNVSWTRDKMKYGEGMVASDSLMWKLHEKRYWSKITDIYYIQTPLGHKVMAGLVVAVAPYMDYSLKFPVMVPHLGGVLLTYSDGYIEDVKPEQFGKHHLLQGVRLVPKELAKKYVGAYQTKNGLVNYYFRHIDQVVIADPGYNLYYWGENMPYLLPTESGQEWFVAAMPWGANGSYKFFYIDATSGDISVYSMGSDSGFLGPRKALDYVRTNYPQLDVKNSLAVVEPRPIFRGEKFYWMYTLTTSDYAGVVDTVLVEAHTSEMLSCGNKQETLERFLRGDDASCRVITIRDTFNTLPEAERE